MKYLSLFSGCCGGDLGLQHLLGWECLGYVEWDKYCQKLIRMRQDEGYLTKAPIFTDIREFISEGYADSYKGMVDVVTGGFPCQPFSVAGKQAGESDERNMWPPTLECIRRIQPRWALLENVAGLLANRYIRRIFGDLAESGYDAKWSRLSTTDVGGTIIRRRIWVVAVSNKEHGEKGMGDKHNGQGEILEKNHKKSNELWLQAEPNNFGMDYGFSNYVGRVNAIGNAQVPVVAATAWKILSGE